MTPFEYLLLFAAILLGLAITDVALSLHRLLAAGGRVTWDWLSPLAALVAFLKIVTQWWTWFGAARIATAVTFEMFLGVLAGAVLLFLLAAETLPDEVGAEGVDLKAHFAGSRRRFWIIFTTQWLLTTGVNVWVQMAAGGARLDLMTPVWLIAPVTLTLAFVRNRWVQTAALAGFAALYLAQFFGRTLTG